MRLVHVIRTMDPRTGGPASVVAGLTSAQRARGDHVEIVIDDAAFPRAEASPVPIINLAKERASLSEVCHRVRPDALVIHGVWCRHVLASLRHAHRQGLPFVVASHGALGRWSLSQKAFKKRTALALLYRRHLNRAQFFIANNERERRDLMRLGLEPKIELIPHGVGAQFVLEPGQEDWPDSPAILFLGRLAHEKDPLLLLDAFARLARDNQEVRLFFAGPDGGLEAPLEEASSRLPEGIRERVILLGPRFGDDKWRLLGDCSVLCLPSRYESFGMVLIEALARGRPVVYTDECGFPEIAEAGAGLAVRRDAQELARALSRYLDPEFARAAAQRGLSLVRHRYTWEVVVDLLADRLATALARSGGRDD